MEISNMKFLNEACNTIVASMQLDTKDATLLLNACIEAALWRKDHNMPHCEKYGAMAERLRKIGDSIDRRIDEKCKQLAKLSKKARHAKKGI